MVLGSDLLLGVIMFPNISSYMAMREKAKTLPELEVTEEEFIRMMIEAGETPEKAKLNATLSKGLGSSVMIGDKMIKIKDQ